MNDVLKCFVDSVTTRTAERERIAVKFKHHAEPDPFTLAALDMLYGDPAIEWIISESTGDVIYQN